MKTIIVVRHPEKDGDKITALGAMQAFATALALGAMFPKITQILWSGANRAWQAAMVTLAALGGDGRWLKESRGFHFEPTFTNVYGKDAPAAFKAETAAIKERLGKSALTVADALEHSEYARQGRVVMTDTLFKLASTMKDDDVVLAVSHSPWLELAALDPATMPYGIGEAEAVAYHIEDSKILTIERVLSSLAGKANC
ncbi:phosphoglycerate mutase family protein [Patescibacteria group bacterium]|nr:MAG: phosphoglycerate mutase family protein [Patescibacteria group bacterium]